LFGLGHAYLLQDRIDDAVPILENGLAAIGTHDVLAAAPWVAGRAAYAFAKAGRQDDYERAVAFPATVTDLAPSMRHAFANVWAARGALALGRLEEAHDQAERALHHDSADRDEGVDAWAM